ncbi:hypothetical protein BRD03_13580 [Halobacteriales archaeon QS_9_68_17]|nr:MAG: hypothetical protein BRD03_13580 [Halobacteriales archaeon QS_9_68_17]
MSLIERRRGRTLLDDRRVQAAGALLVAALATVPFVMNFYVTELLFTGLVFVILGVSWNLLAGYAGQISLGHAAFFGMGAFVSAWLTTPTGADLPESIQLPVLLAVLVGGLVAALISLVVGPIMFRLRGHYFAIGTLALAAIIQLVMQDQREYTGGATGYFVDSDPVEELVPPLTAEATVYLVTLAVAVLTVLVTYRIVESPTGLGMKAIHDDEDAASGLGVDPLKYKMYAFVVSSFFAGIAGALYAQYTLYINPGSTLDIVWTIDTLVIVILGGMGTVAGPLLGAGLFLGLDNLLSSVVGELSTAVEGALIVLFIVFLPSGVYGLIDDYLVSDAEPRSDDERATAKRSSDATDDG